MKRVLLACSVLLAATTGSLAAGLALDGNYGSKDGCRYAKTGESSGADDFFLLTREAVTTATAFCEIRSAGKQAGDTTPVTLSCQAEGEDEAGTVSGKIIRAGKDRVKVTFDDGSSFGPYARCR